VKIMFDAWDPSLKEMIPGDQLTLSGTGDRVLRVGVDVQNAIPLLYSEFKDTKKQALRVGHIIHMEGWKGPYFQVRYVEDGFCLAHKDGSYAGDIYFTDSSNGPKATIVGDIYNNPEYGFEDHNGNK